MKCRDCMYVAVDGSSGKDKIVCMIELEQTETCKSYEFFEDEIWIEWLEEQGL